MDEMGAFGRVLIFTGLLLVAGGLLFVALERVPWLGHLPGDIYVRRGSFTFYFPVVTCILISVLLSLLLMLFRR